MDIVYTSTESNNLAKDILSKFGKYKEQNEQFQLRIKEVFNAEEYRSIHEIYMKCLTITKRVDINETLINILQYNTLQEGVLSDKLYAEFLEKSSGIKLIHSYVKEKNEIYAQYVTNNPKKITNIIETFSSTKDSIHFDEDIRLLPVLNVLLPAIKKHPTELTKAKKIAIKICKSAVHKLNCISKGKNKEKEKSIAPN